MDVSDVRPPVPARLERLIQPENPIRDFFQSIPGFHMEMKVTEKTDEAKFLDVQKLIAMTELLKTKYPQYDYSIEEVKSRLVRRQSIAAKIKAEEETFKAKLIALQKSHQLRLYNLKRDQQLLVQLEQIDDNLLIIEKEMEETRKNLSAKAYKEAKKQKLAALRHERNEAYLEAVAMQDANREKRARRAPIPDLVQDDEQVNEEYDFSAAASA